MASTHPARSASPLFVPSSSAQSLIRAVVIVRFRLWVLLDLADQGCHPALVGAGLASVEDTYCGQQARCDK
jgi:hypothetical protein